MNTELTKTLKEKYPAIFKSFGDFEICDGWYGIVDVMCSAMDDARTTSILIDQARGKAWGIKPHKDAYGSPHYPLCIQSPQVIALQVKEKYATLRFHYRLEFEPKFQELICGDNALPEAIQLADRYHSFTDGIIQLAETISSRTCEETGLEGELHVSSCGEGWWRTLNREFAKTNSFCKERKYIPVAYVPTADQI